MTRTAISPRLAIRIRRNALLTSHRDSKNTEQRDFSPCSSCLRWFVSAADVPTCFPFFEERAEPFLSLLRDTLRGDGFGRESSGIGCPPRPDTGDEGFRGRDRIRRPAE